MQDFFGTPEINMQVLLGEDGYGEGDYISTLDDFAESRGLGSDYSALDLEQQRFIDQEAFNAGYRSPSFQSLYNTGNLDNLKLSFTTRVRCCKSCYYSSTFCY